MIETSENIYFQDYMQAENIKLMVKIMKKKVKVCVLSILDLVCLQHEQNVGT